MGVGITNRLTNADMKIAVAIFATAASSEFLTLPTSLRLTANYFLLGR
jgi:hypothetical protein